MGERKEINKLLDRKLFLIAVGPSEASQRVHQGVGQDAHIPICQHRGRPVSLAEGRSVWAENHWQVGIVG